MCISYERFIGTDLYALLCHFGVNHFDHTLWWLSFLLAFYQDIFHEELEVVSDFTTIEWMLFNLLKSHAIVSFLSKYFLHEIFEIFWKVRATDHFPVFLIDALDGFLTCHKLFPECIFVFCHLEWEESDNESEQDYSHWENICLSAIVLVMSSDFWSHIAHGTTIWLQAVDTFVSSKPEVGEFKVHFLIN
jgi:hypothetical protein